MSEYITFEPLENPLHPPAHLPSPHSVLAWQAGDAFDAALLLASLLLGAGFDAFVVVGYAPRAVTLRDLRGEDCPLVGAHQAAAGDAAGVAGAVPGAGPKGRPGQEGAAAVGTAPAGTKQQHAASEEPGKRKKYQLRPRPAFTSKVVEAEEAAAAAEAAVAAAEAAAAAAAMATAVADGEAGRASEAAVAALRRSSIASMASAAEAPLDPALPGDAEASGAAEEGEEEPRGRSKRVHAWVLVLPGRREVRGWGPHAQAPSLPYGVLHPAWTLGLSSI